VKDRKAWNDVVQKTNSPHKVVVVEEEVEEEDEEKKKEGKKRAFG